MSKPFPLLCGECKYSSIDPHSIWLHMCHHPRVLASDSYALSKNHEGRPAGSHCTEQRRSRNWFAPCGIKGKLWEPKTI